MKNLIYLCFVCLISFSNCNSNQSSNKNKKQSLNLVNCKCNSVEDCLDKNDFECARIYCAKNESYCDRIKIIEIESLFWLNQNVYSRSKEIALEIFSLKKMEKIDMNNWYAEKLDDIINAMVNDGKVVEAEIIATDFPLELDGDNTFKFKLDALNTIAVGYSKSNMKKEQINAQGKIKELQKLNAESKKQKIDALLDGIVQLKKDQKLEAKNIQKEVIALQTSLKDEKKILQDIRNDFYVFSSRRDDDIERQTSVINNIESQIGELKHILTKGNNDQINKMKEEINNLKSKK